MADGGFRPATEGAGNEILKAVNEIYDRLTGEEEDAHPHTLPEADEEDNKGVWLTEETARKIVESLGILASKIDDRKDNTFTVNQNGASTEYNTYAAKSISVPVPSEVGEEGQVLVTSEGGETSEWSNTIGGVTLKGGYIKGESFETTEGEMSFGDGFKVDAEGNTEITGDTEIGGMVDIKEALTVEDKATLNGGIETTDIEASGTVKGSFEGDLEGNAKTATTAEEAKKVSQSLNYTINGVSNSYDGSESKTVNNLWIPTSSGEAGQILMSGGNTEGLAPAFVDIGDFFSYNSIKYSAAAKSPVRMWRGDGGSGNLGDDKIIEITDYCSIYQLTLGDVRIISARCETTSAFNVSGEGASYGMHITDTLMGVGTVMSAFGCTFNPRSFHANNDDTSGQIDVYVGDGTDSNKASGDHSMGYQLTTTSDEDKKVTTAGNWIEFHDSNSNPPKYGIYITVIGLMPGASYTDVTYD